MNEEGHAPANAAREDLRARIAATVMVHYLSRSVGNAGSEDRRRVYAADEAVKAADALLEALDGGR